MALFLGAHFQGLNFISTQKVFYVFLLGRSARVHTGGEEAETALPLAPKRFCCRLWFPKQPSSPSDHLQGGKNKNKTKHGSR